MAPRRRPRRPDITPGSSAGGRPRPDAAGPPLGRRLGILDLAPAGPIPNRPPWLRQAPVSLPGEPPPTAPPGTILVESRPVTNEMNVLTDHGAYWANPEGFIVPLVRHLDAALGDASASRFYRDRTDRTRRIVATRARLGARGVGLALFVGGHRDRAGVGHPSASPATGGLSTAGDLLVATRDRIPGHEIVSAPVSAFETVVDSLLEWVGLGGLGMPSRASDRSCSGWQ